MCIVDDAIPFVGKGRNVMHGYISGADSHIIPGQPCLVVDSKGTLVAHGTPLTNHLEMQFLRKGIAVKVRMGRSSKACKGNFPGIHSSDCCTTKALLP